MIEIAAAVEGIRHLRDFTKWVGNLRDDAEALPRINDALREVGTVQDKLYELRDENLRLQEENRKLSDQLREQDQWAQRKSLYSLVQTPGGGMVYQSAAEPVHYVCPACLESRRELHPLQDLYVLSGEYKCPACKAEYPINLSHLSPGFRA